MADTEAPTSAATVSAEDDFKKESITIDQASFVTLMLQYYGIQGRLMTTEEAVKDFEFTKEEFTGLLTNEKVQAALKERGVVQRRLIAVPNTDGVVNKSVDVDNKATWKDKTLLPEQLVVANVMLNLIDGRSNKKKLQDLSISPAKYQAWMKDPVFYEYMRGRSEEMLKEQGYNAHLALLDKVNMGDMTAIKYFNELTDRYKEQAAALNTQQANNVDFRSILVAVVEIINDEVTDPQMAMNIATKIKGLINANHVANELIESAEIVQPKVMAARELTPELQKLMTSGEGYE